MVSPSILFLGKADDAHCQRALDFCRRHCGTVTACLGHWGASFPDEARRWGGDLIVSYLSRWVVPPEVIDAAELAAVNFHPAPPEYPGIGCNNFALYDNAAQYGVTCHHMAAQVDTGPIIAVQRFPVHAADNVESLLLRTYDVQLVLFYDVLETILSGRDLPVAQETWQRKPITRAEFNELGKITRDMSDTEIARRVRATSYGRWQPTVELGGYVFKLDPDRTQ